jgi:copper homeostasis protein (lipoprotein)
MEADYKALESAYTRMRKEGGDELLVSVEGQAAMRPSMDGEKPVPTLVVERFIGIWPGETCGAAFATSNLQETYWKLTRLHGNPVVVAERQREPHIILRSGTDRVSGFAGCNTFSGGYKLNGNELTFSGVASTMMACIDGMEQEPAFLKMLDNVRKWKITGEHLELDDADGKVLARLESRLMR